MSNQKKRKPRSQKGKKPKNIKALHVSAPNATREETSISKDTKDLFFIPYFRTSNNLYVNDIALRARRSPTHSSILRSKITFTCGQSFAYSSGIDLDGNNIAVTPDEWVNDVNSKKESLRDIFKLATTDFIKFANTYIEVVKSKNFTSVFSIDSTKVRISFDKKNALITPFWRDIKNSETRFNEEKTKGRAEVVPLWDGNINTKQKRFIIHIKQDASEYDTYGLTEHHAVYKSADLEYKTATYNLTRFKNGFMPSAMMTFFGTPPEGTTPEKFISKVVDKFTDEGNNSKILAQLVDDVSQKPEIFEFSGTKDGEFLDLDKLATQNIIKGHRWFPELAGILISGKLGGSQELRNQYDLALNTVVKPDFQEPLLRLFNLIVKISGRSFEVSVINTPPVGVSDQIKVSEVLSKDEQREILGYEPSTENKKEVEQNDQEDGFSED